MTKNKNDQDIIVLLKQAVGEVVEEKGLVTHEDIKHLPTKDEFYKETLRILKKLNDLETEKDVLSHNVSEHSDRIEALEKIHPNGVHFASI